MLKKYMAAGVVAATLVGAAGTAFAGKDLDAVKARGSLICGVATGVAGFASADSQGKWTGLDVDTCRAIAAAIFGDADKVKFVPTTAQQRFTALQSGEVDLLVRTTTWTLTRDTALGFDFTGVNYYDGQGFMVNKKLGVKSAKELNGATVCVQPGTTTELNLADYFRANKMTFKPVVIEKVEEVRAAFFSGRCDVFTTDASGLYSTRAANAPNPDDYIILPEIISKEPLGPVVRHGDNQFADIVRWALFAQLEAEEYGITSKNVDEMLKSDNPSIKRILGVTPGMGKALLLVGDDVQSRDPLERVGVDDVLGPLPVVRDEQRVARLAAGLARGAPLGPRVGDDEGGRSSEGDGDEEALQHARESTANPGSGRQWAQLRQVRLERVVVRVAEAAARVGDRAVVGQERRLHRPRGRRPADPFVRIVVVGVVLGGVGERRRARAAVPDGEDRRVGRGP